MPVVDSNMIAWPEISHHILWFEASSVAVAYINCQGGTRSLATAGKLKQILYWTELHGSALSPVYILGMVSWQHLDQREWFLHMEVFQSLNHKREMPEVDLPVF